MITGDLIDGVAPVLAAGGEIDFGQIWLPSLHKNFVLVALATCQGMWCHSPSDASPTHSAR